MNSRNHISIIDIIGAILKITEKLLCKQESKPLTRQTWACLLHAAFFNQSGTFNTYIALSYCHCTVPSVCRLGLQYFWMSFTACLASSPPPSFNQLRIQPAVIHAQGTFILKPELTVTLTESSAPVPSCSLAKPHSQNQRHSLSHHQRQSQSTLLACRAQLAFSRGCTVPPQWGWSSAASQSGWLTRHVGEAQRLVNIQLASAKPPDQSPQTLRLSTWHQAGYPSADWHQRSFRVWPRGLEAERKQ